MSLRDRFIREMKKRTPGFVMDAKYEKLLDIFRTVVATHREDMLKQVNDDRVRLELDAVMKIQGYRYDVEAAEKDGTERHPQQEIKDMARAAGAKILHGASHPIGDCWVFIFDREIDVIPPYVYSLTFEATIAFWDKYGDGWFDGMLGTRRDIEPEFAIDQ